MDGVNAKTCGSTHAYCAGLAQQIADLKQEAVDLRAAYAEVSKVNAELRRELDAQIALNVENLGDKRALQGILQRGMGVLLTGKDKS